MRCMDGQKLIDSCGRRRVRAIDDRHRRVFRIERPACLAILLLFPVSGISGFDGGQVRGGEIRLWSTAVDTGDGIRLTEIAEVAGFEAEDRSLLTNLTVADSPPCGGSRVMPLNAVREALHSAGVNLAAVRLTGSLECAVTRPLVETSDSTLRDVPDESRLPYPSGGVNKGPSKDRGGAFRTLESSASVSGAPGARTLRDAVVDHFRSELVRQGGDVVVGFDRGTENMLTLTDPPFRFRVRRRGGAALGLVSVEVEVIREGAPIQRVPMAVNVTLRRPTVVARRPINQGALIRSEDVGTDWVSVIRLDQAVLSDPAFAVGQRARRFVAAGAWIEPGLLEAVPLVKRGELVTMSADVDGVRVVTSAKADADGLLGDMVRVRAADKKRHEFDAIVVGPGAVEIRKASLTEGEGSGPPPGDLARVDDHDRLGDDG